MLTAEEEGSQIREGIELRDSPVEEAVLESAGPGADKL